MGEVVARVDGGLHVAAVGTEEAEVAFAHFGRGPVAAEGGDRDGHGQVVAKAAQQVRGDHGLLRPGGQREVGAELVPIRWVRPEFGASATRRLVVDEVGFLLPVGLQEDAVDVVDVDGFVGAADGLDQAADAEVAGLAQDAVGGADDEIDGGAGEGVVSESDAVEFAEDEVAHVIGIEAFGDDGVGDAAFDVLVDAEVEGGEQAGPADEDEVVVFGEVLEEQAQLAQVGQVHEVGVVEDGGHGFAGVVEAEGLLDESAFTFKRRAFELDAEGVAEDFDGVGVGMKSARDGGD